MESQEKFIIGIILFIVIAIGIIILLNVDKGYYEYKGLYGDFIISPIKMENLTFYDVHTIQDGRRYIIPLHNKPEDVENIYLESKIVDKLNKKEGIEMLYVTKDPDIINLTGGKASIAVIEFGRILGTNNYGLYKINTKSAVTKDIGDKITPVITCSDINSTISVIHVKLGKENRIYSENKCVIVEGIDGDGLIKAADKFSYHLMGIMWF